MSEQKVSAHTVVPAKKLKVFLVEEDSYQFKPLFLEILRLLHETGIAGATVCKGTQGFGTRRVIHTTKVEVLSLNLPLTIEAIDAPAKIDAIVPQVAELLDSGMIEVSRTTILRPSTDVTLKGEE